MKPEEKQWLLSLPKEAKLMFIESLMKENNFTEAFTIAKVFLDTPISNGGVSTDEIKKAMDINKTKINKGGNKDEHRKRRYSNYQPLKH